MIVTLRPLQENDARMSYQWRNDAEIWKFTGDRPSTKITEGIEREWIRKILARTNELRFAICTGESQDYVGNVQLTCITEKEAEFHIFIGELSAQRKGVGTTATKKILDYAHHSLRLKQVYLSVHPENIAAIRTYEKSGFELSASDGTRLTYLKIFPL